MDKTQFEKFYLYVVHVIVCYIFASYISCTPTDGVKIQHNKYFDGEELVTIYKISLQRCICECNAKNGRCHSLIYKRSFTSCRLNVKNATAMNELLDKPGSVYIEMDNDVSGFGCDIYITHSTQTTDHSAVPFNQSACGKPPVKANATYMGNLYSNGSRIKYVCNAGFKQFPQTESVSVCLYNESWSDINFTCKPDTILKPCKNKSECFEEASECSGQRCVCIDKYSYSLTEYACVPGQIGCENCLICNKVPDENFQASSYYKTLDDCYPQHARLVSNKNNGTITCTTWAPEINDTNPYIQVNLTELSSVRAIITKGRESPVQYVTSYKVQSSIDGSTFLYVQNDTLSDDLVFDGNNDATTLVTRTLPCPIEAQYIRIRPQTFNVHKSLKFELIGCTLESADCDFKNSACGWQHVNTSLKRWKLGRPEINTGASNNDPTCTSDNNSSGATSDRCMCIESDNLEYGNAQVFQAIRKSNASRCLSLSHAASARFDGSLNIITTKCEQAAHKVTNKTFNNFERIWKKENVSVESGVYQIVIEGVWTKKNCGVLMIDDVKLLENICP